MVRFKNTLRRCYKSRFLFLIAVLSCLLFISAIKINYGGEVSIRLNEPDSFIFFPSNYSNLVFYSLIYENLFYLKNNGDIRSHIFEDYKYNKQSKTLILSIKDNISYSSGDPVTTKDVKNSLRLFLDNSYASARKIRSMIKNIKLVEKNRVAIELLYDNPGFVSLLTSPELVLLPPNGQTFSGIYYPAEKVPGKYLILRPNRFYPGGRSYVDTVKVLFYDAYLPDIFLSRPGKIISGFKEFNAGVYQNIYILFPGKDVSQNTRIALYSLLKIFYQSSNLEELNSMTSNDESPISLNIKKFSLSRIRSILRYLKIKLHIPSSLSTMETEFQKFLKSKRIPIETIYLGDNQLANLMNNTSVKYLLLEKVFTKRMPLYEKIKKIVKELSFARFNAKYLKLINELDEVKFLKNEELLFDQVAKIVDQMIKDGFILPLFQERYSTYIKNEIKGIEVDYYGRPLFQGVRVK
ncbi:ABC transporter substrate-binding protein [Acidobacteriota bacterium]